jgi:flavin reductase (DIM6/NTAB) family NADH-FMN oxidoreductase RutF
VSAAHPGSPVDEVHLVMSGPRALDEDRGADRYLVARTVLAELPCPVVLIAAAHAGERSCATGTAMYVSFSPPALVVAVHPGSRTCRLIEASGAFSVSLLADDQVEAATIAGRSSGGIDKLAAVGLGIAEGTVAAAPAAADVPIAIWCRVTHRHAGGDHVVFVGEVVEHRRADAPAPPLLRQRRRYARLGPWLSDESPGGYPT